MEGGTLQEQEDNIKIELTTNDYVEWNKVPHSRAFVVTGMKFGFHNISFLTGHE
jgi:hypothetical protein